MSGRTCTVPDCQGAVKCYGLCSKHASRLERHGDALRVIEPGQRQMARGPANARWAGSDVTYSGVHQRLARVRGVATSHPCSDCGGAAAHWSLDDRDAAPHQSDDGPFSTDLDAYSPRCVSCHKVHDLASIGGVR